MSVRRRVGVALVLVTAAGCSADRMASVPTRPDPPTTSTTTTIAPTMTTIAPTTTAATTTTTTAVTTPPTTAAATTTTADPFEVRAWARFDEILAARLLVAGDHAASVAVSVDGRLVHQAAYGDRVPTVTRRRGGSGPGSASSTTAGRARPNEPVRPTDRFRIASISKVITAAVVLQLVEDDVLRLDEPVGQFLARHLGADIARPDVATVTPRQLLSHTSGFPDYDHEFFGGGAASCTEVGQRGLAGDLVGAPGTVYNYSNLNFCLLGELIEASTGQDYETVVTDRLLTPLGIEGMRLAGTIDPRDDEVIHPSIPTRNYMEVLGGAGAWVATASDVVRIVSSLDPAAAGWHPLSRWASRAMVRPPPGPIGYTNPADDRYGLGLFVYSDGSWGHTGTVESAHAMVVHRPDGVTWSILVSGEYPGDSDQLRSIFDDAFAQAGITL